MESSLVFLARTVIIKMRTFDKKVESVKASFQKIRMLEILIVLASWNQLPQVYAAPMEGLAEFLFQPNFKHCLSLSCMNQLAHRDGEITDSDYLSLKAKFAPYLKQERLSQLHPIRNSLLTHDQADKELKRRIAASFFSVKEFARTRNDQEKIVFAKIIRGERVHDFLRVLNQNAHGLQNIYRPEEKPASNSNVEFKLEKMAKSQGIFEVSLQHAVWSFVGAANLILFANSLQYHHLHAHIFSFFLSEGITLIIFGSSVYTALAKGISLSSKKWNEFLNTVEGQRNLELSSNQFAYFSSNSKPLKSLLSEIKDSGFQSPNLAHQLLTQALLDKVVFKRALLRAENNSKPHEDTFLNSQYLYQKSTSGDESLIATVTAHKNKKPRPPAPEQKRETEMQEGMMPEPSGT